MDLLGNDSWQVSTAVPVTKNLDRSECESIVTYRLIYEGLILSVLLLTFDITS